MASHDVPIGANQVSLAALNERSREIFRQIVESYLATGEPVGSRNLARLLPITLSPASVRNVMSDLEQLGLIFAPHTSAGRLPTELGLRFFVDALMQIGDLTENDRRSIEAQVAAAGDGKSLENVAHRSLADFVRPHPFGRRRGHHANRTCGSSTSNSCGSSRSARLPCWWPKTARSKTASLNVPAGLPTSALVEAANFLNARIRGKTLAELRTETETALVAGQAELDQLTQKIISAGLASWSGGESEDRKLIVRGHANLLEDLHALEDLERVRSLFDALETKREVIDLLGRAERGDGVRIFIGSENKLFSLSGSSTIVAPYRDSKGSIRGRASALSGRPGSIMPASSRWSIIPRGS